MTNNNEPNDENKNPLQAIFEQIMPIIGQLGDNLPPGFGTTDDFHRENEGGFNPQDFIERFGGSLPEELFFIFNGTGVDPENFTPKASKPQAKPAAPSEPEASVVNVQSTPDGFPTIYVPVPGFSKNQILGELKGNTLHLSTAKSENQTHLKDLNFKYVFSHSVDPKNLDINCENGLLTIKVKDESQSYGISIT